MSFLETKSTNHAYVNVLTKGDLSSLSWVESPLKHFQKDENPEKKICSVYYASVNFRDVMLATGGLKFRLHEAFFTMSNVCFMALRAKVPPDT